MASATAETAATAGTPRAEGGNAGDRWFEKAPGSPLQRFPVLGEALVAVAERWTDSFSALSASPGELVFLGLRALSVGDLMRGDDGLPIFAALKVPAWDCPVGLALGRPLISTVIEAFFGGGGDEEDARGDRRSVSAVEMRIVDVFGGQAATALTAGFKEFLPVRFEFERTQAKPDPSFLGKPPTPMIAAAFEIKAVGRAIRFEIVLPLGALESRQDTWAGASKAPVMDDARWAVQFKAEVVRASMRLKARIDMAPTSLGDVAAWRVGQVVELPHGAGRDVLLTCEDEVLFHCELGQSSGRYTLRIGERAAHPPSRKGD